MGKLRSLADKIGQSLRARWQFRDFHDINDRSKPGKSAPVKIGNNAWLGARAIILKGVTIGKGAVAAGALVNKDVPSRSVAAGVPARIVRYLDGEPEAKDATKENKTETQTA